PASAYLRIATVPGRSERFQCLLTCLFRGSLIDRFQGFYAGTAEITGL
ncbi:hypothetical protein J2T26_004749, partial [Citrobacter farmeri]|nr:hypothetical protein [Citrobacter farmeri]MCW2424957.1 hypothetical protein [Citrobacter farmeri]